jgi:uncharacterized protein YjbI with pentapeptide repeats
MDENQWYRRSKMMAAESKLRIGLNDKTLWDWLQLLIVPIVLATLGFWFNIQQSQISEANSERQHMFDQQLALDQQREATLKTYQDDMANLLLSRESGLRKSKPGDEVQSVARARTLTALRRLDPARKGELLQFIYEAGLIGAVIVKGFPYPSDAKVDLRAADLSAADLHGAYLPFAQLYASNLSEADLSEALLGNADLVGARMRGAKLHIAILYAADLHFAILEFADLSAADLSAANLSAANLHGANLSRAILDGAILDGANLSGAKVTNEQLVKAKSLKSATMPDGSKHP